MMLGKFRGEGASSIAPASYALRSATILKEGLDE